MPLLASVGPPRYAVRLNAMVNLQPPHTSPISQQSGLHALGPTGLLAVAAIVVPMVGLTVLGFHMDWAIATRDRLRESALGPLIVAAAFGVIGGLGLLPTITLSLFAGWAFGFGYGFPAAVLGFGATGGCNYFLARCTAGEQVLRTVDAHPRWRSIRVALLGCGRWRTLAIIALLRLPTVPPFGATSVVLAALKVRLLPFLLGTMVGVMPRTALYVWLATRLRQDRFDPTDASDWGVFAISAAVTILVLAVVTSLARRALQRLTRNGVLTDCEEA